MTGVYKILEETLERLVARQAEIVQSIAVHEQGLQREKEEAAVLARAIHEQRAAVERVRSGRGAQRAKGSRPHARRPPAEGTRTRIILDAVVAYGGEVSLGVLGSRTHLPTQTIRPVLGDLLTRGYVERVSEGVYKAAGAAVLLNKEGDGL